MKFYAKTLSLFCLVLAANLSLATAADTLLINGAGATFPYPLYSKWISEFHKKDQKTEINYNSIGSGGGVRQLLDQTVDFGASDAPMKDEDLAKAKTPIVHIPTVMGAVVLSYNLPGVKESVRLTPEVLAGIYLGTIKKWDDPKIAKINPKIKFPKDLDVMPVYRSDASGTSSIFTDYLSKVSADWKTKVGAGTAVSWPTGLGAKGNEGVTALIKQKEGAGRIGYVELVYAKTNGLEVATLQNKSGQFVLPSVDGVTAAAAAAVKTIPADFRVSITNADGKAAYPISSFTYLLVYQKQAGAKGKKLVEFLNWSLNEGQKMASPLYYAPLPKTLAEKVKSKIKSVTVE